MLRVFPSVQSVLAVLVRLPELVQQVRLVILMVIDLLCRSWQLPVARQLVEVVVVQVEVGHLPKDLPP